MSGIPPMSNAAAAAAATAVPAALVLQSRNDGAAVPAAAEAERKRRAGELAGSTGWSKSPNFPKNALARVLTPIIMRRHCHHPKFKNLTPQDWEIQVIFHQLQQFRGKLSAEQEKEKHALLQRASELNACLTPEDVARAENDIPLLCAREKRVIRLEQLRASPAKWNEIIIGLFGDDWQKLNFYHHKGEPLVFDKLLENIATARTSADLDTALLLKAQQIISGMKYDIMRGGIPNNRILLIKKADKVHIFLKPENDHSGGWKHFEMPLKKPTHLPTYVAEILRSVKEAVSAESLNPELMHIIMDAVRRSKNIDPAVAEAETSSQSPADANAAARADVIVDAHAEDELKAREGAAAVAEMDLKEVGSLAESLAAFHNTPAAANARNTLIDDRIIREKLEALEPFLEREIEQNAVFLGIKMLTKAQMEEQQARLRQKIIESFARERVKWLDQENSPELFERSMNELCNAIQRAIEDNKYSDSTLMSHSFRFQATIMQERQHVERMRQIKERMQANEKARQAIMARLDDNIARSNARFDSNIKQIKIMGIAVVVVCVAVLIYAYLASQSRSDRN